MHIISLINLKISENFINFFFNIVMPIVFSESQLYNEYNKLNSFKFAIEVEERVCE